MQKTIEVLDVIVPEDENGFFVLFITDDYDWNDVSSHFKFLIQKINYYLSCLESDELNTMYPDKLNSKKMIKIIYKYDLPIEVKPFFEQLEDVVNKKGYKFSFEKFH